MAFDKSSVYESDPKSPPLRPRVAERDPQDVFDESTQEYFDVEAAAEPSDPATDSELTGSQFEREYKRYSQDFRDRENGPPGIDADFCTLDGGRLGWVGERNLASLDHPQRPVFASAISPGDARLGHEIMEALTRDVPDDALDVEVSVVGGVATLAGTVPDVSARHRVLNCVEGVPGIDAVRSRLDLRSRVARGGSLSDD